MSSPTPILIAGTTFNFSMGPTLGAIYIGATISAVFYGITILQTATYYKLNHNDPWLFRYMVAVLWIFDTLHVALTTHALYFYLIKSFGNYFALLSVIWSFPLQLVFDMLINISVQALYAVRIWKFGRHFDMVLPRFILVAVVASTAGTGFYMLYNIYTLANFLDIPRIRISIYIVFSTMVMADFTISGAMCFYLHKGRSMTKLSSTTKSIARLIWLVLISGLLTSICYLLVLVTASLSVDNIATFPSYILNLLQYIVWQDTLIFIAVGAFFLPKLYINSLLAMLNSRKSSTWSVGKDRPVDQNMIRFAPQSAGSGTGQMNITIPGLSVTGAETNISIPLPVTEGSRSNGGTGDMTFA
ncbi:hypothetical protein DFS33DRAFT_1489243 [Desarmillaria ectypa]|nr:hypothetical protein DFS33DRAFT_1489243 [Desarmillaria ectypa]